MRHWRRIGVSLALASQMAAAQAEEVRQELKPVAGHERIAVISDADGDAQLVVDGLVLLEDGVIFLDEPVMVGGVPVVTGLAGTGGNACGAAPFVLALPEGAAPALFGPIDSCREVTVRLQPEALVFSTEPLPSEPGEIWVWNPVTGLNEALPEEFAADPAMGWETLPDLALAHPVEAMKLAPVLSALQTGLGPDYPAFAERISDLGSGDLVPGGYLGRACLKFTCDADWAVLYLDASTERVFAIWQVEGEGGPRLWPADRDRWTAAALAVLREIETQ
jgi:hypothetical protein